MKTLLLSLLLAFSAFMVFAEDKKIIPQQGTFQDGTTVFWACEPGMKGSVRIVIQDPDGTRKGAELPCTPPGSKEI